MSAAYEKILELSLARELFDLRGRRDLLVSVALWKGGLPVDVLPPKASCKSSSAKKTSPGPRRSFCFGGSAGLSGRRIARHSKTQL